MQPWHWFVFGIVLMVAEIFVPTFFLLWFGAAAVVTALVVWIMSLGLLPAAVIWLILSVIFCIFWFKFINPHIKNRTKAGLGAGVIIGEVGMIIDVPHDEHIGKIRFTTPKAGASEWACRSYDEALKVGDRAVVTKVLGNELIVAKK